MEIIQIDRTKNAEDDVLGNLLRLHRKVCEEESDVKAAIQLTKYLNRLLKKRGKEPISFAIET